MPRWFAAFILLAACGPAAPQDDPGTTTTPGTTAGPVPTTGDAPACGDGLVDDGEACDDGNHDDADACSSACTWTSQQMWHLPIDDDGLGTALGCAYGPHNLAVTADLQAVLVGCVRALDQAPLARQAAATADGQLIARTTWPGKVEWVVAPGPDTVLVAFWDVPQIRSLSGELLGELSNFPVAQDGSQIRGLFAWGSDGFVVAVDDGADDRQRFVVYEHLEVSHEITVQDPKRRLDAPQRDAAADASGAIWGRDADRPGLVRIDLAGLVDIPLGADEDPLWFALVPGGGAAGARSGNLEGAACNPFYASLAWRWSADGALQWTAEDCDGDLPATLGPVQLDHIAVDGHGDVIVTGTTLQSDLKTLDRRTILKLDGATGERRWQTFLEWAPGVEGSTLDALKIGVDDSIFVAGREGDAHGSNGWIRRFHP